MRKIIIFLLGVTTIGLVITSFVYAQNPPEEGIVRTYYENGLLKAEAFYRDHKRNGSAKRYYEDGTLYQVAYFKDDKLDGIAEIYYPTGQLEIEKLYKGGELLGVKKYDVSGNLTKDTIPHGAYKLAAMQEKDQQGESTALFQIDGLSIDDLKAKVAPLISIPFIILMIAVYILQCVPLQIIANKEGTARGWLAYIPIVQLLLMCQIAGKPSWWVWAFFILPFIPIIGPILLLVMFTLVFMGIAKTRQRPAWLGILMLFPVIGTITLWYIALSGHRETIIERDSVSDTRLF